MGISVPKHPPFPLSVKFVSKCTPLDVCVIHASKYTPPNLINIQGHELEGAFIVHTLACLEIHGQITH